MANIPTIDPLDREREPHVLPLDVRPLAVTVTEPNAVNSDAVNSGAVNSGAVNSGAVNSGAVNVDSFSDSSRQRLPEWLRRPPGSHENTRELKQLLRKSSLNTVCEEARCPNISECFQRGTATFMILGDICTRGCRFCSVITGKPKMREADFEYEGQRVADAANELSLKHVVVTSVARDDLADGGASGFVHTIKALRDRNAKMTVEVLVPDFRGREAALELVVAAGPDVFNHNLETVPRLYRQVRPGARYDRSLRLLRRAKELRPEMRTKTGLMLGLGETTPEVDQVMRDARDHFVDIFTAGQYLQPTRDHLPVVEYVTPELFSAYRQTGVSLGFEHAFMDPLVRSSYHAGELLNHG